MGWVSRGVLQDSGCFSCPGLSASAVHHATLQSLDWRPAPGQLAVEAVKLCSGSPLPADCEMMGQRG